MIMNGLDREGKPFTGLWLGGMAGGAGARSWNDGIDTAGFMPQTRIAAPNVETCERLYPILEVYRKECPDTVGHGKHRGGIGMEHMIIPYKSPEDLTVIRYSHAVRTPEGRGISGGYPAPVNVQLIYRNTDIRSLMASGKIPRSPEDISHESFEDVIPKSITHMGPDDVRVFYVSGGGGYGDPLDRPIHLLEKDLREGLCSPQTTNTVYGAVLDDTGLHIDEKATLGRRRELKQLRIESGAPTAKRFSLPFPDGVSKKSRLRKTGRIGEHLAIERKSGRLLIGCVQCGHVYGPADQDPKIHSFMRETPVTESHWINALSGSTEVCLREYFCPACGTLFSVNIQRKSDPLLIDMRLA
jgi:N-methylhydantoinase B